jgi:hypothetical protein
MIENTSGFLIAPGGTSFLPVPSFSAACSGSVAPNREENVSVIDAGVKMLPRSRIVLGRAKGDDSLLCRQ